MQEKAAQRMIDATSNKSVHAPVSDMQQFSVSTASQPGYGVATHAQLHRAPAHIVDQRHHSIQPRRRRNLRIHTNHRHRQQQRPQQLHHRWLVGETNFNLISSLPSMARP
jgi:hypothetical protein